MGTPPLMMFPPLMTIIPSPVGTGTSGYEPPPGTTITLGSFPSGTTADPPGAGAPGIVILSGNSNTMSLQSGQRICSTMNFKV